MSRLSLAATAAAAVLGATGCQTFIGIEDAEGHLPHLDGDYLVGLKRKRVDNTEDTIRLVGTARLDPATRELRLSLNMLAADDGRSVSENAITGLVFDDDASQVTFDLSIAIRPEAVVAPITNPADNTVAARMVLRAEGDYAFCASPEDGAALPSIGTILVAGGGPPPEADLFDTICDEL